MICQMVLMDDPEQYLLKTKEIYNQMNNNSIIGSDSKLISSITISNHTIDKNFDTYIKKTDSIFKQMKENHKWLTSDNDLPFAALLAVSDIDINMLFIEIEKCYQILKNKFEKNAAQSLSHVLVLYKGDYLKKCNKVIEIFDGLKKSKHSFGTNYELSSLGMICSVDIDNEQLINEICEVDNYLKRQKCFGIFSVNKYTRRMYAALIVMSVHNNDSSVIQNIVTNNISSMILSMEYCKLFLSI